MRIVASSSLAQKHPRLFSNLRDQHEMTLCASAKIFHETLITQQFWNIALAHLEDIPQSNAPLTGSLFCVVPLIDSHTLSLLKRSDVEDLLLDSELDWYLPEKIKKWERLQEKALAQFPLHELIHDVKTPLAVIHTTLEILILKKCQESSDSLLQKVQSCKSHLDRIKTMFSNFVDMSRTMDLSFSHRSENVNTLISQVLESQASRMQAEGKKIGVDQAPLSFELDRNTFKQMIHNMLDHFLLFSEAKASGDFLIRQKLNELHVDLRFASEAFLPEEGREKVFDKTARITDPNLGLKYNKGFGLTYNHQMALSLGGKFLLDMEITGMHVLRLQLPAEVPSIPKGPSSFKGTPMEPRR